MSIIDLAEFQERAPDRAEPLVTEDRVALVFAERHADSLRYDHNRGRWYVWNRTRWQCEETKLAFSWAREIARELRKNENAKTQAIASKAAFAASVERFSQSDRALAVTSDRWDASLWETNTPAGIVDLHTGAVRPPDREAYCTKITAVSPSDAGCPTWISFLQRITNYNEALMSYLQRMCGYCLTGSTREHALFFLYGTGSNGKSVFINTISGVLGNYAGTTPIETFTASHTDRHPTELAGLEGARMVSATETEQGRRWAETRIKLLTGGDRVAARFMRQDFFYYVPQFKIVIAGNHKPAISRVDEAIRRRLNLIPFAVTIPQDERDPELSEKLKAEWSGVLQWMIDGCLEWERIGLSPPPIVVDATKRYFETEDAFSAWLDDCCVIDPNPGTFTTRKALVESWTAWATSAGEDPGSNKVLFATLEENGFLPYKKDGARGFKGISLKYDPTGYKHASAPDDIGFD